DRHGVCGSVHVDSRSDRVMPALEEFLLSPSSTIEETLRAIESAHKGIALVVDPERRLIGTVTDGDVRRAILGGVKLDEPIKTLLPVGDRPLLEHIITQLRCTGIRHVQLATHYKPEEITKHFGDGRQLDMDISYIREDEPLGTAGVLGLLPPPTEPMLLINGDILTKVDFGAMLQFHREHQAELTAGVRRIEIEVPYGIVEHRDWQVTGL